MARNTATRTPRPLSRDTQEKPLRDKVALVAGATRGAGRGIALALGEAGAIVYCTGRSTRGQRSSYDRSETIEETAELVTAAGGTGIALRVDHTIEAEVRALFEHVDSAHGRLDVLADSVAGEDPILGGWTSFWETDLSRAGDALRGALLSHVLTAQHAARLMIRQRRGLIVEVTEGDLMGGGGGNVVSGLVKSGLVQLVVRMAEELRTHKVAAIAITPGYLRSESMLQRFGVTETTWRDGAKKDPNFLESESPLFVGRAVAALAGDRTVLTRSGHLTSSWELGRLYGFTDSDGTRPDWGTHFASIAAAIGFKDGLRRQIEWLEMIADRARCYLGDS